MEEEKYVDVTIYLDEDVARDLKKLCEKLGCREEDMIREAMEKIVEEREKGG